MDNDRQSRPAGAEKFVTSARIL